MSLTDPIGDMISRIKNAHMRNHKKVKLPSSKFKMKIVEVLKTEGFIIDYKVIEEESKSNLEIKNLNPKKRPISAVADNQEVRNAKKIIIKTNKRISFNLLYDKNRSLQKKIKVEQLRREVN